MTIKVSLKYLYFYINEYKENIIIKVKTNLSGKRKQNYVRIPNVVLYFLINVINKHSFI